MNYSRRILSLACVLIMLTSLGAKAQTLNDNNKVSDFPMYWYYPLDGNPEGRLWYDYFSNSLMAFPGSLNARAHRAFDNVQQQATPYIYEFGIGQYQPVSEFGFRKADCSAGQVCQRIYWQNVSSGGLIQYQPSPTSEDPNPPVFTVQQGDRLAVEWTIEPIQNTFGRFNFYINRTQVFQLNNTAISSPFNKFGSHTVFATFYPSTQLMRIEDTREIGYSQ